MQYYENMYSETGGQCKTRLSCKTFHEHFMKPIETLLYILHTDLRSERIPRELWGQFHVAPAPQAQTIIHLQRFDACQVLHCRSQFVRTAAGGSPLLNSVYYISRRYTYFPAEANPSRHTMSVSSVARRGGHLMNHGRMQESGGDIVAVKMG